MSDIHRIVNKQVNRWNVEREILDRRHIEEEAGRAVRPSEQRPVVTISRQRGCRGKELGKIVSHELRYGLFDREIIEYIAEHASVRREVIESLDEKDRSDLELWIDGILSGRIVDHDDYIRNLSKLVKTTALQGGVVILGRGANYFLSQTSAYRVRIIAPLSKRIENLISQEGMTEKQARDEIERVDRNRAEFVKRYFQKDIDDSLAYDITINLGSHSLDGAVKIILSALRAKGWTVAQTGGDKRGTSRK